MKTLVGFCIALLLATGLSAQYRGGIINSQPILQGGFGNVVFPGGGGPRLVFPGAITDPAFAMQLGATVAGQNFRRQPFVHGTGRTGTVFTYGYPVYVGGYVDNSYPAEPAPQQQPNVTVIYPPQPAPVIINLFGSDHAQDSTTTTTTTTTAERQPVEEPASTSEPSHYLIAFKDHTIYWAVAYWVDGDTLHYFTSGNTHNQVSLSLIDRDLTQRLNKESGLEVNLPPAK
jgi:hypothetical protein